MKVGILSIEYTKRSKSGSIPKKKLAKAINICSLLLSFLIFFFCIVSFARNEIGPCAKYILFPPIIKYLGYYTYFKLIDKMGVWKIYR